MALRLTEGLGLARWAGQVTDDRDPLVTSPWRAIVASRSALPALARRVFEPLLPWAAKHRYGRPRRPDQLIEMLDLLRSAAVRAGMGRALFLGAVLVRMPIAGFLLAFCARPHFPANDGARRCSCGYAARGWSCPRRRRNFCWKGHRARFARPNVGAKRRATALWAGRQAQNGAQPQRLTARPQCRCASA